MKRILGLKPSEKENCINCKYVFFAGGFSRGDDDLGHSCKKSRKSVNKDMKCIRYIKKDSFLDKVDNHLLKHWKYWITTIILLIGALSFLFK